MPKTIETTVFTYDELPTEKAKQRARDWYLEGADLGHDTFNDMVEDAKRVGLKIICLDSRKNKEGEFIVSAVECSEAIFREHGKDCDTYKTALAFDAANDALPEMPEPFDYSNPEHARIERELCAGSDENEATFLCSLLEDYRLMMEREIEHLSSEASVAESILSNEYTFTEDGARFG